MQKLPLVVTGDLNAIDMRVCHGVAIDNRCLYFQHIPGCKKFAHLCVQPGACLLDLSGAKGAAVIVGVVQAGSQIIRGLGIRLSES